MKIVLVALLAAAVCALPSDSDLPSVVPETPPQDFANTEDTEADLLQTEARMEAEDMMRKAGANACEKLADATEDEVKKNVAAQQDLMDKVNKGKTCKDEGQAEVNHAVTTLASAESTEKSAKKAFEDAQDANVDFGTFKYKQLSEGRCSEFFGTKAWKDAKAKVKATNSAYDKAKGATAAAKTSLEKAKASAKQRANRCHCKVRKNHVSQLASMNKTVKDANIKAWTRAAHLKCVLKGTSASSCKVPSMPEVKASSVAAGVKTANCGPNDCTKTKNCVKLTNWSNICLSGSPYHKGYKCGGGSSWDNSEAYSTETFPPGTGIAFQMNGGSGTTLMVGLDYSNSGPSYTDLDYCWYRSGNSCYIYERGSNPKTGTCPSMDDNTKNQFEIRHCKDGNVRYYYNAQLIYKSKNRYHSTSAYKVGSSFYTQNSWVRNVQSTVVGDDCDAVPLYLKK